MGLLTKISEREKILPEKKIPAGQASLPATPVGPLASPTPKGPAEPCTACGGGRFWLDPYGRWSCENCTPPKLEAFVRGRHEASVVHTDGLEAREDLGCVFGPPVDLGDGRGPWREFLRTDGIHGIVQAGNERMGMAVIDAFEVG
jgi:hypothetical protein